MKRLMGKGRHVMNIHETKAFVFASVFGSQPQPHHYIVSKHLCRTAKIA